MNFMLAVIKDIEPRDQIEAMLKRPPEGGRRADREAEWLLGHDYHNPN
jgi:hypothetical protein